MPVDTEAPDLRRTRSNSVLLSISEAAPPVSQEQDAASKKLKRKYKNKKPKRKSKNISICSSNGVKNSSASTSGPTTRNGLMIVNGASPAMSRLDQTNGKGVNRNRTPTPHLSNVAMAEFGSAAEHTAYDRHRDGTFSSDGSCSVPGHNFPIPEPGSGPYWCHPESSQPHGDNLGVPGPSFAHPATSPHSYCSSSCFPPNSPMMNGYPTSPYLSSQQYYPPHGYMPYPSRYYGPNDPSFPGLMPYSVPPPPYFPPFPRYFTPQSYHGHPVPYHESRCHDQLVAHEIPAFPSPSAAADYASNPAAEHYYNKHPSGKVRKEDQGESESLDGSAELSETCSSRTAACESSSGDELGGDDAGRGEKKTEVKVSVERETPAENSVVRAAIAPEIGDLVTNIALNDAPDVGHVINRPDSPFHIRLALCSFLEVLPLTEHLLRSFEGEKFTDAEIILTSAGDMFSPVSIPVHQVIVAQSPVLASIQEQNTTLERKSVIHLTSGEKFCLARAFETAVQNFYGLPLVDGTRLKQLTVKALGWEGCPIEMHSIKNKEATIDFAVCYGISGAFLHSREILETGLKLVTELIDWDTVQLALHFGLAADEYLVTHEVKAASERPTGQKGAKGKGGKKNTKKDSKDSSETTVPVIHDTLNAAVVEVWAPKIVTAALYFMIRSLPTVFHFDRLARVSSMADRIPPDLRAIPGSVLANPKLASVRFGSLSSASEQKPSKECSITSAVFLSLPFKVLREAFEIMRERRILAFDLVKAILHEREERRLRALQAHTKKNPQTKEEDYPAFLKELGYAEYIVRHENEIQPEDKLREIVVFGEFSLEREWKGYSETVSSIEDRLVRTK